jgi:glycosyltransferase involved in cell wall biosynthesis
MVEDSGLSDRVEFHGYREWPESVSIIRNAHLTVLASRHEGFCLGLAELMGMGLPAIAFSCGGVIEQYLKDGVNGYVVPWGNVSLMADRIAEFYDNPEKWRSFSTEASREIRTNYGMALFAARYAALIDETPVRGAQARRWPRMRPLIAERNMGTRIVEKIGRCLSLW